MAGGKVTGAFSKFSKKGPLEHQGIVKFDFGGENKEGSFRDDGWFFRRSYQEFLWEMVCLINTEHGKWYVYCPVLLFRHCQHLAPADPKSANNTDGRLLARPHGMFTYHVSATGHLLHPIHQVFLAIHKAFQVVNGRPLPAITSLLGVIIAPVCPPTYPFIIKAISGGDSNQLHVFASKTGPTLKEPRKRPCLSIRCCNNKISFLWCQRFWKTRPCRSLFGWRGKWHLCWLVGVFFWDTRVQSTRVKGVALKIHVCVWVEL